MPVRTGAEYIRGLKERPRDIRINGEKVTDVTTYPGLSQRDALHCRPLRHTERP